MQTTFAVTVPFFALVLIGYLAARRRVLPLEAVPGLNAFVLYVALPCMLFRFGATLPLRELLDPVVISLYLVCALVVVGFTIAITLKPPVGLRDAAFGALVAAFPNSGFMGVPLLVALLGPAAAGPVMSTMLVDLFITSSLCIALAQARHEQPTRPPIVFDEVNSSLPHGSAEPAATAQVASTLAEDLPPPSPSALLRSLRAALANPLPWSIALGALLSGLGLKLPGPADRVVAMLADAASPVALFTIGAVLWRAGHPPRRDGARVLDDRALLPARTPLRRVLPVALIKLLLHPLLVLMAGLVTRWLGGPLSAFQLTVLVLTAALPSASNVSLLAERYGADNGRIARIIMMSTVLAFGSFSALAWMLGAQPR